MSNYRDMATGLGTVIANGVTGVHVFDVPPDSINEFPAAIVLPEPVDPTLAFAGNTFTARFRVVYLTSSADNPKGWADLYDAMDPTSTNTSVIKAIRTDLTLNGKADSSDIVSVENAGRRELGGGAYYGVDFVVEAIKTVA